MGKGDRKSRRGKITIGSYGVRRPRKKKKDIISQQPVKIEVSTSPSVKEPTAKTKKTTKKKE